MLGHLHPRNAARNAAFDANPYHGVKVPTQLQTKGANASRSAAAVPLRRGGHQALAWTTSEPVIEFPLHDRE